MDKVMILEQELKLNYINLIKYQSVRDDAGQKEYRSLLIQRSNIKDMLIAEYRTEVLERRKDYEYTSNNQD